MDAPWLLPIQNVTGVVALSTNTRRIFVKRGRRYSVISLLFGLMRSTRSLNSPPDQTSPFLSAVASYGQDSGDGACHSLKEFVRVSNMPTRLARFSPNHSRPAASIMPRRGAELRVGVG